MIERRSIFQQSHCDPRRSCLPPDDPAALEARASDGKQSATLWVWESGITEGKR